MGIYVCRKCLFSFEKTKSISSCPDCGYGIIRVATKSEADEYWKNKMELSTDESMKARC